MTKHLFLFFLILTFPLFGQTPQTSDAALKAAQSPPVSGLQIWGNNTPTFSGQYANLTFVEIGGLTQAGTYNIADSTVSIITGGSLGYFSPTQSGTVSATLIGHVTSLSMNDTVDTGPSSDFQPTIQGQLDSVSFYITNGTIQGFTSNQTATFSIASWYENGSGTITIVTANVTSFSFPDGTTGYGILTFNGAYDQPSTDSILVGLNDGGTANTVINIGGTSSTPSSTGLTAETSLVSNGCTVTTN